MDTSPDPRLENARALLESGEFSLPELAAEVGLSPAYLQKRFKQAFGLSPAEYAAKRRVAALKQHLKHAPDVTQAWVDSGFGSCSRVYENGAAKLGMSVTMNALDLFEIKLQCRNGLLHILMMHTHDVVDQLA